MNPLAWLPLLGILLVIQGLSAAWSLRNLRQPTKEALVLADHIDELRHRILIAVGAWLAWSVALFGTRLSLIGGIWIPVPTVHDTLASQVFAYLQDHLVPDNVILTVTRPLDGFVAQFSLALLGGFILSFPVILGQVIGYFGPALKPEERHALRVLAIPSSLAFLSGSVFGYAFILPFMLKALYGYAFALGAAPLLTVSDLVSFTINTIVVFGLAFQTPIVMMALSRIDVVQPKTWAKGWRQAVLASVIVGAITTDPSLVSQLLVAGPLLLLYAIGWVGAHLAHRNRVSPS